jgi:hypothetical protein
VIVPRLLLKEKTSLEKIPVNFLLKHYPKSQMYWDLYKTLDSGKEGDKGFCNHPMNAA